MLADKKLLEGTRVQKLHAGMRIVVSIGTLVILALVAALYMKFKKALFILLIPTAVTVMTVVAILTRRHRFVWPIIATSMFHVILACYALLIFSFYFFFKPFYIIMVLNWAFDTAKKTGQKNPL
ncbi:hypothetical protein NECAME_01602 [Necator americanus]|uniref:Uncharacterized protein n=1 Tax=Necator americanus TaxID=51031 RepID=W2TRT3_NECAM|nr:hypothetical protein NECAME_01602 [Necator americanus]ETN84379.1 hypothetical protein NECAME_01602 [Necator americanus]